MTTESGIAGLLQKPERRQWVNGRYVAIKQKVKKKPRKREADSELLPTVTTSEKNNKEYSNVAGK